MPKLCTVNDTQRYVTPRAEEEEGAEGEAAANDRRAKGQGPGQEQGRDTEEAWVMHSSAAMCGAPYTDTFTLETRLKVFTSTAAAGGSVVEVTCKVACKPYTCNPKPKQYILRVTSKH